MDQRSGRIGRRAAYVLESTERSRPDLDSRWPNHRVRIQRGRTERDLLDVFRRREAATAHAHPANDKIPSFSRDGKWIYFNSNRGGENQIWKLPAAGGEPRRVTYNTGNVALESIDGGWLYYTLFRSPSSLWRIPASGGPAEKILDSIHSSRSFDVVEQGIYYLEPSHRAGYGFSSSTSAHVNPLM